MGVLVMGSGEKEKRETGQGRVGSHTLYSSLGGIPCQSRVVKLKAVSGLFDGGSISQPVVRKGTVKLF